MNSQNVSHMENNSSELSTTGYEHVVSWLHVVSTSLAALALVLNTFTLVVFRKLRSADFKPRLRIVLSLTLNDLVMSSVIVVFMAINGQSVLTDGLHISQPTVVSCIDFILKLIEMFAISLYLLNLLAIAVDQLISVVVPLKYVYMVTATRMNRVVIGLWISAFTMTAVPIAVASLVSRPLSELTCVNLERQYGSTVNAGLYLLSAPVFLAIYATIYRRIQLLQRSSSNTNRTISIRKATVTSIIIIAPFLLFYLPAAVYVTSLALLRHQVTWPFWELFIVLLAFNTGMDPVIYAIRMQPIQRIYRRMFHCGRRPTRQASW